MDILIGAEDKDGYITIKTRTEYSTQWIEIRVPNDGTLVHVEIQHGWGCASCTHGKYIRECRK